jgi:hypothetical protein
VQHFYYGAGLAVVGGWVCRGLSPQQWMDAYESVVPTGKALWWRQLPPPELMAHHVEVRHGALCSGSGGDPYD